MFDLSDGDDSNSQELANDSCSEVHDEGLSIDGVWNKATIKGHQLIWESGDTWVISQIPHTKILTVKGRLYTAELRADDRLYWNDGDIWTRVDVKHNFNSQDLVNRGCASPA
eukprot:8122757-Karenia_brevis.AAC.1